MNFAGDMLRQTLIALKTLHGLGYSHGDLKPENICVRESSDKGLKFSLIDFGLCTKLPVFGAEKKQNKYFRGNLMFCSDLQLMKFIPNQFCDLISLANVAYYIVLKEIPATKYARE